MAISESWRKSRLFGLKMSRSGLTTDSGGDARFSSRGLFLVKKILPKCLLFNDKRSEHSHSNHGFVRLGMDADNNDPK
jgi:hypothetical protein